MPSFATKEPHSRLTSFKWPHEALCCTCFLSIQTSSATAYAALFMIRLHIHPLPEMTVNTLETILTRVLHTPCLTGYYYYRIWLKMKGRCNSDLLYKTSCALMQLEFPQFRFHKLTLSQPSEVSTYYSGPDSMASRTRSTAPDRGLPLQ